VVDAQKRLHFPEFGEGVQDHVVAVDDVELVVDAMVRQTLYGW
jgi:hypothetical protein